MSEIEVKYILTLGHYDGQALKHLLGNMTDADFSKFGISGNDRERMREIYSLIPHPDEELDDE